MNHTPGPWRIGDAGNTVFGPKTDSPSPETIAKIGPAGRVFETKCANARLIAAAPEMLEALSGLFEHCAMVHKHWGEGSNQRESDVAIAAAKAAIAKATNRTQPETLVTCPQCRGKDAQCALCGGQQKVTKCQAIEYKRQMPESI